MNDRFEIHVTIKPDGKVVSEVKGIEGPQCQELSKFLDSLGQVEVDRQTPDYRKQPRQGIVIRK